MAAAGTTLHGVGTVFAQRSARLMLEQGSGRSQCGCPNCFRMAELTARCGAAGMTNMAELAEALSAVQEHSFGLFRFVGDLNLEVERLEDRAEAAEAELESSRATVAAAQQEQLHRAQVGGLHCPFHGFQRWVR